MTLTLAQMVDEEIAYERETVRLARDAFNKVFDEREAEAVRLANRPNPDEETRS